jgi:hypothetical protein
MGVNATFKLSPFSSIGLSSKEKTIVDDLLVLLFSKPGFIPSMPNIGVNIRKYLTNNNMTTDNIKQDIVNNCQDFYDYIVDKSIEIDIIEINNKRVLSISLPTITYNMTPLTLGVLLDRDDIVIKQVKN